MSKTDPRAPVPYRWGAITRYRCPRCPVDRDTEAEVLAHIADKHPPEEPTELQRMTAAAREAEARAAKTTKTEEPADG